MGVQVSGTTVSVTIENADSISWTSHLLFTGDNTYDIGASGATRPRTGYFGTSVVSPLVTNAGTLALSATGANIITLSTNATTRVSVAAAGGVMVSDVLQIRGAASPAFPAAGAGLELGYDSDDAGGETTGRTLIQSYSRDVSAYKSLRFNANDYQWQTGGTEKLRLTNTGNVLVGTTTDGNYKLDVAESGSSGTLRVYDQTATTGSTSLVVRAGAGQSTNALTTWQNNAASQIAYVSAAGNIVGTEVLKALNTAGQAGVYADAGTGSTYHSAGLSLQHGGSSRWFLYKNNNSAGDLYLARYDDAGSYLGAPLSITRANGYVSIAESGARIGFFGATPVVKQTVTADAASILAALQAYGLAV